MSQYTGYLPVNDANDITDVTPRKKNWIAILTSVLLMNGAQVFMSEAMQGSENEYNNTLVLTSIVAASYAYCLVAWFIWWCLRRLPWAAKFVDQDIEERPDEGAFSWKYLIIATLPLSILSKACRDAWYFSLHQTNAAANLSIYQSSSAWVFLFSLVLLREKFDWVKALAVVTGIGGCVMVAMDSSSDSESGVNQNIFGYVDLLASVWLYAVFQVLVKRYVSCDDDPHPQMNSLRLCGLIGCWCMIWGPLSVLFVHVTGIRRFEPPPAHVVRLVAANGFVDALFTGSLLICIRLADPTFASVATSLSIPLSIVADRIIHNYVSPVVTYLGMIVILAGCLLYNFRTYQLNKKRLDGSILSVVVNTDQ
ncbi:putative solute carrier family 35 member F5-like [Diplonema papillatum]|nr:putative solute carrier family 35 member F5-like [Diplonema papillatum]